MTATHRPVPPHRPGPVAVVTGAGSGIGRAVARLMLADGYRVVLAGRREAPLLESAAGHRQALTVPCDVTEPDDLGPEGGEHGLDIEIGRRRGYVDPGAVNDGGDRAESVL